MMKKYVKLLSIMFLVLLCSGCVKLDTNMKINNTKSMSLDVVFAVDKSLINDELITDSEKENLKELGYTIKDYKNDSYEGINLKWKIHNIDEISTTEESTFSLTSIRTQVPENVFTVKKSWFVNEYNANFVFDSTDVGTIVNEEDFDEIRYLCDDGSVVTINMGDEIRPDCNRASDLEIQNALSDNPLSYDELNEKLNKDNELKFVVKVANGVIDSNADDTSNKSLTWNLNDTGLTKINFSFRLYNYFNIVISIVGIILFIIFLLILLVFLFKKFKKIKIIIRKKKK